MLYLQALVDGLIVGLIFALVAMGLSLIYGVMDIVNFAHGEFMMVAMYVCYFLWDLYGLDPLLGMPVAAALLYVLGVLTYRWLIRYVLEAALIAQIFITFGLMVFLQALANFLWKADFRNVRHSLLSGVFDVGGLLFHLPEVAAGLGALLTTVAVFLFVHRTETGLALQATAQDRVAAQTVGIDVDRMFSIAWGVAATSVAVAGALLSSYFSVYPLVGATWVLPAFVAVALGGFGNILGAFFGGLIIGLVEVMGGFLTSPNYKLIFVYLIYLVIVFVRPQGLLGTR